MSFGFYEQFNITDWKMGFPAHQNNIFTRVSIISLYILDSKAWNEWFSQTEKDPFIICM